MSLFLIEDNGIHDPKVAGASPAPSPILLTTDSSPSISGAVLVPEFWTRC